MAVYALVTVSIVNTQSEVYVMRFIHRLTMPYICCSSIALIVSDNCNTRCMSLQSFLIRLSISLISICQCSIFCRVSFCSSSTSFRMSLYSSTSISPSNVNLLPLSARFSPLVRDCSADLILAAKTACFLM